MTRRPTVARDVLEEFAEHAGQRLEEDFLESHALHMPPWREKLLDDTLSPFFGPTNPTALAKLTSDYNESTAGGGLWDDEEARRMNPKLQEQHERASAQRYDYQRVTRYVELHSHELPLRELEVYFGFYRDRLPRGAVARNLGIHRNTVEEYLKRLRKRAHGRAR